MGYWLMRGGSLEQWLRHRAGGKESEDFGEEFGEGFVVDKCFIDRVQSTLSFECVRCEGMR